MGNEDLTSREKSVLLGSMDKREIEDYDEEFYALLHAQRFPLPHELDDRIRRAIFRFIDYFLEGSTTLLEENKISPKAEMMSKMHCCLLVGYELGRKLQMPLTKKIKRG